MRRRSRRVRPTSLSSGAAAREPRRGRSGFIRQLMEHAGRRPAEPRLPADRCSQRSPEAVAWAADRCGCLRARPVFRSPPRRPDARPACSRRGFIDLLRGRFLLHGDELFAGLISESGCAALLKRTSVPGKASRSSRYRFPWTRREARSFIRVRSGRPGSRGPGDPRRSGAAGDLLLRVTSYWTA